MLYVVLWYNSYKAERFNIDNFINDVKIDVSQKYLMNNFCIIIIQVS